MKSNIYKLTNVVGVVVEFISLGGRIISVKIPNGKDMVDIIVGYDSPQACAAGDGYMGAICGRYANRIDSGRFSLDGELFQLDKNNEGNHLHGGNNGFHTKYWEVTPIEMEHYSSAYRLSIMSPDGDENYPGNLQVDVTYALNNDNELHIEFNAISDKKTIINLTNHPYFNLKGIGKGDILDHTLEINSKEYTPVSQQLIPTGELKKVAGTAMDFTTPHTLLDRVNSPYEQIKLIGGIDHNWVIDKKAHELSFAARVTEPVSGRSLEVFTTQPGIQVYTALHFDGSEIGKGGYPINRFSGLALEAQNFPDAPNHIDFPNCTLDKGEVYQEKIIYRFNF